MLKIFSKPPSEHVRILLFSTEMLVVSLAAYHAGIMLSTYTNPGDELVSSLWCVISAVVVMENTWKKSLKSGFERMIGTSMGGLLPLIYLYTTGLNSFSFSLSIITLGLLCCYTGLEKNLKICLLTGAIVYVICLVSHEQPMWMIAVDRVVESLMGITVTVFVRFCTEPAHRVLSKYL